MRSGSRIQEVDSHSNSEALWMIQSKIERESASKQSAGADGREGGSELGDLLDENLWSQLFQYASLLKNYDSSQASKAGGGGSGPSTTPFTYDSSDNQHHQNPSSSRQLVSAFEEEKKSSPWDDEDGEERHLDTVLEMTLEDTVKNELRFKDELEDLVNDSYEAEGDEEDSQWSGSLSSELGIDSLTLLNGILW